MKRYINYDMTYMGGMGRSPLSKDDIIKSLSNKIRMMEEEHHNKMSIFKVVCFCTGAVTGATLMFFYFVLR